MSTTYSITVKRGKHDGQLMYKGSFTLSSTCWWDPKRRIPKGTYLGCSATHMATKLNSEGKPREAIFLPGVPGFTGIFIHMGTSAAWSDGCVVIVERDVKKIWDDINPKNGRNVTVEILDS